MDGSCCEDIGWVKTKVRTMALQVSRMTGELDETQFTCRKLN